MTAFFARAAPEPARSLFGGAAGRVLLPALWVCAALYFVIVLAAPHFGPRDDEGFLTTVMAGRWYPFDVSPSVGRFDPLSAQELNLISLVAAGPFSFYLFNALELVAFCAVFYRLVRRFGDRDAAAAAVLVVLLTPGFADGWLALNVNDRDVLVLLASGLWCYFEFERGRSLGFAVGALLAANLALYEKEPCCIALGVFALLRVVGGRTAEPRARRVDILLLVSCAVFVLVYYLLAYRHWAATPGTDAFDPALMRVRNITLFATTDPVLVFLLAPVALSRGQAVLRRVAPFDPIADPLLGAAFVWILVILVLDMSANRYYCLPAYAFAMPGLARTWPLIRQDRRLWAVSASLALFVTLTSALPGALFAIGYDKYVPRNWSAMVEVLARDLLARPAGARTEIVIEGVPPDDEICSSLPIFLASAGVPGDRFEVRGEPSRADADLRRGDFLLVVPQTSIDAGAAYLHTIEQQYRLLWRSVSPLAVPDISLHSLAKRVARSLGLDAYASGNFSDAVDFFVFEKR